MKQLAKCTAWVWRIARMLCALLAYAIGRLAFTPTVSETAAQGPQA